MPEQETLLISRVLANFFASLTREQIIGLEQGTMRIAVVSGRPATRVRSKPVASALVDEMRSQLAALRDREAGLQLLADSSLLRSDLKAIADDLGLGVPKSDTVERLRDRIVEATIGFRLRSEAIRGVRSQTINERLEDN